MASEVNGTVFWFGSRERVVGAIVKALQAAPSAPPIIAFTDDDGDYKIDLPVDGEWQFQVLHEGAFSSYYQTKTLSAGDTISNLDFNIKRYQGEHDKRLGIISFVALISAFIALLFVYAVLHRLYPPQGAPADERLSALVVVAQDQVERAVETRELESTVAVMFPRLQALISREGLSKTNKESLSALADRINEAVQEADTATLAAQLSTLDTLLGDLSQATLPFWSQYPWRIPEILLVALIAVIGSKIVEIGVYLRWQRFYAEGIYMHLTHIVVHPIFVLAAVLLISLGRLEFTLANESSLNIDLSNPIALVVISFLLGTQPWPVLGFIQNTAERILGAQGRSS